MGERTAQKTAEIDFMKPPRSAAYLEKTVEREGNVWRHNERYFQRIFTDGSAELIRFDLKYGKWVVMCFPKIKERVA